MSNHRKILLRRFLEDVWNDGRIDACDLYIADAYTIRHDPGDPWDGQTLDLAGFKNRLRLSRAPFPDQRFEVQEMIADGDAIAIHLALDGYASGRSPGLPGDRRADPHVRHDLLSFQRSRPPHGPLADRR